MAITREHKEELVSAYGERLRNTDGFIVAEYRGMSVPLVNELRKRLRDAAGGTYTVTKNTLFAIALRDSGWPVPDELLIGPVGIVFGNGNLPGAAKTIQQYVKDFPNNFAIKGGVLGELIFTAADIEAVANLPTMDELRAQIAGIVVAPAAQLAGLLEAATSQVVNVIQAYVDKQESGEAA